MNKTFLHKYKTFLISLDLFAILLSLALAYFIRFKTIIPHAESDLEFSYFKIFVILAFSSLYILNNDGQYNWTRHKNIIQSQIISLLVSISIFYLFKGNKVSRLTLVLYFIFSTIFLLLNRRIIKKTITPPQCLLIGDSPLLKIYKQKSEKQTFTEISDLKSLNEISSPPDQVVMSFLNQQDEKIEIILNKFSTSNANIQIIPYYQYDVLKHELTDSFKMPILTLNTHSLSWSTTVLKRTFDVIFSFFSLILLSPLLLILAFIIKITSQGPIFYGQQRMGLDGKLFTMWKLRSMRVDAEKESGAVWAKENDPRTTSIGAFLRKTSLDELPQFWNVLKGDMSVVGPRPERPELIEKFKLEIPAYMLRHKMKAGVTGWAQISGLRGNCDLKDRISADLVYIKDWSFWFDLKIIFLTLWREVLRFK